ncbi:WAG22 antigen-like [Abeliophyllum distichum]|uniref:WAG22 antigen-like n=1 Tax=Abeliophyllum distichum TaxID=126358 RepID=A0ABD1T1A0_9LAMI
MAKLYVMFVLSLVLVHATARNIPTETKGTNPNSKTLTHVENTHNVAVPGAAGVDDQKNFVTFGGMGGCAGIGGVAGVLPVLPVLGGVGGVGGAGGGIGGLGGIGKVGGGVGGAAGAGGILP